MTSEGSGEWDPEPADLRDGEVPDDDSHASINEGLKRDLRRLQAEEDDD